MSIKDKFLDLKDKVEFKAREIACWVCDHPVLALAMIGAVGSVTDKSYRIYKNHREDVRRRRTFYDPRKGRYSESRRNLRPYELDEIDARYEAGESYNHILLDMGLLK